MSPSEPNSIRDEVVASALAVARHVHDGGYRAVIVSGSSNQLARSLLALGWRALYPREPVIRVFALDGHANTLLYKHNEQPTEIQAARELSAWIAEHIPDLAEMKDERLCLVDDFMFTGMKHFEVRKSLTRVHEFRDIHFAYFGAQPGRELEHERDVFVGGLGDELVLELHRLSRHIQGVEDPSETMDDIEPPSQELRKDALDELRDIGKRMK